MQEMFSIYFHFPFTVTERRLVEVWWTAISKGCFIFSQSRKRYSGAKGFFVKVPWLMTSWYLWGWVGVGERKKMKNDKIENRKGLKGKHMVLERRVAFLSSPAVSRSTQIPWHRWDRACVFVWVSVYGCVIRHLCHGRWWWNTLRMAPLRALPSTQQEKYALILSLTHI